MPNSKAKRKPKTSSGRGIKHRKSPQSEIALIIMGKGKMYRNIAKKVSTGS